MREILICSTGIGLIGLGVHIFQKAYFYIFKTTKKTEDSQNTIYATFWGALGFVYLIGLSILIPWAQSFLENPLIFWP